jgi:hypothetical protein
VPHILTQRDIVDFHDHTGRSRLELVERDRHRLERLLRDDLLLRALWSLALARVRRLTRGRRTSEHDSREGRGRHWERRGHCGACWAVLEECTVVRGNRQPKAGCTGGPRWRRPHGCDSPVTHAPFPRYVCRVLCFCSLNQSRDRPPSHPTKFCPEPGPKDSVCPCALYTDRRLQMDGQLAQVVQAIAIASDPSQGPLHQQALDFLKSIQDNAPTSWRLALAIYVEAGPDGARKHHPQARFWALRVLDEFFDNRYVTSHRQCMRVI